MVIGRQTWRSQEEQPYSLNAYSSALPAGEWSVGKMSALAGLSVSYFQRKFKLQTGLSPYDYLIRKKIDAARQLLLHTDTSITQIACALGFSSSQHFANTFKQYEGKTPTQFRKASPPAV